MNLELKARIIEANLDVVDINGFKYNLHLMELGTLKKFKVLLPIFDDVMVGDCFVSTNWIVTRYGTEEPIDLCVRVDSYEFVHDTNFSPSKYLISEMTGLFLNSEKCFLRTIGPDAKPFYAATLRVRDCFGDQFSNILIAFGNQAKKLSTVKKNSVIKCEVTVKARKYEEGYEFAVNNFEIISEGKQ